jgi:hypothetical protein
MRGSISISEAYCLTREDMELINALIKDNLETAKKTGRDFW